MGTVETYDATKQPLIYQQRVTLGFRSPLGSRMVTSTPHFLCSARLHNALPVGRRTSSLL